MRTFLTSVAVVLVSMVAGVNADETAVPLDKLPKAVTEAIKKMYPTAEFVEAVQEKEDDEVDYEVTVKVGGKKIDITVEADGTIEGQEKELDLKDLPAAVVATLEKNFPKATRKSAEAVFEVEDGKEELEYYEIQLETADKKEVEAKIKADGTLIMDKAEKKEEPAPKK